MMTAASTIARVLAIALLAVAARAAETLPAELDQAAIRAQAAALLAIPARSPGTAGGERAARLIADRLAALGLTPALVRHTVTVPVDHGTTLTVGGVAVPAQPHLPNGVATAGTGGAPVTGPIVWLGDGELERFTGKDLHGAIAAFDGTARDGWRYAAQLGARAAVFQRSGRLNALDLERQTLMAAVEFPRVLADLEPAMDGREATLTSRVTLEPGTSYSVLARIPGVGRKGEAVLIATGYEAPSGLGGMCPGATEAWNAAVLLELAARMVADPPKRDVIIVFEGARAEYSKGLRHLLGALTSDRDAEGVRSPTGQLDVARKDLAAQRWRCQRVLAALVVHELLPRGIFAPRPGGGLESLQTLAEDSAEWPKPDWAEVAVDEARQSRLLLDGLIGQRAADLTDATSIPLFIAREHFSRRRELVSRPFGAERVAVAMHQAMIDALDPPYGRYRDIRQKLEFGRLLDPDEDAEIPDLAPAALANLIRHAAVVDRRSRDAEDLVAARAVLGDAQAIHAIALGFTDGGDRFSCLTGGGWVYWTSELNWLSNGLINLADDLNKGRRGVPPIPFDRMPYDMPGDFKAYFPAMGTPETWVSAIFPLTGAAAGLATTNDLAEKVGTPLDTAAGLRGDQILAQTVGLHHFLHEYVDSDFIANRRAKNVTLKAPTVRVEMRTIGGKTGKRAYAYGMATLGPSLSFAGPVGMSETVWCDAFGTAQAWFIPEGLGWQNSGGWPVRVYGFDAGGRIDHVISTKGQMGGADIKLDLAGRVDDVLPLVFPCVQSRVFDVVDPRLLRPLMNISVLSATRDAPPNDLHVDVSPRAVAVFTGPRERLRFAAAEGAGLNQLVITGKLDARDTTTPGLVGLPPGQLAGLTALDAARDMIRLNAQRVELLRKNGISSDSLVTLHSRSERHLDSAEEAFARRDYREALGQAQAAWALAGRVYPAVLGTANDVVYGLVVMLLFAIPFALVCERLFLAGNTIIKKVAGFAGFFAATFLFFFFFHPAFDLATTPMIIFLAFVIIIMSTWVATIVYKRFEHEMEQIRNARLGIHKADVSRLGTIFATVALGISNMRRRPLRTFLTGMTVVLMTFILLTFASFTSNTGAQRLALDAKPGFDGIMIRRHGWTHLPSQVIDRVASSWGDRYDLHPVRWLDPTWSYPKYPLAGPKGSVAIGGLAGFAENDPTGVESALIRDADHPETSRGFGGEKDWLFLPPDVIQRLGWKVGAIGRFWGRDMKVGLLDTRRLAGLSHLSGEALTPLAPEAMDESRKKQAQEQAEMAAKGGATAESTSYTHLSPNNVGIVHLSVIDRLSTGLVAVTLTPKDKRADIDADADEMAQELALTLRVASRGDGYLLTAVGKMDVAGLGAVLVPLILGGLIIFSTMLNSVAERGKEIFIYSSLGLAPVHVASLFLVEASIYAVLGGLGGYMTAQLIASGLGVAARFNLAAQPDLNYSSFTAVTTILLVMATVLVSAMYPALIASRAANPGNSEFRVPQPDGDQLAIDFPFTVARRDIRGLLAYLAAYFDAHTEASTGCFTAADAEMSSEGENHRIGTKVWLAPFDLGISQRLVMKAVPTDVKAIYAVHLDLELLSGQRRAWRRANFAFLAQLRQQFLVWRTLSPEAMDKYRAAGGDPEAKARLAASTTLIKAQVAEMGVVQ